MQNSINLQTPAKKIKFEPSSGEDRAGKIFHWNNKIYRGINRDYERFYQKILEGSIAEELYRIGLVHTVKAKESFEDFRFVLQHDKIPLVTYPTEWCQGMLKDAALVTCDIEACLIQNNYALKDAHPWNVLFHNGRPVFVDFGSIIKKSKAVLNFFLLQCRSDFIRPLMLKRSNFRRLVDTLMITDMGIWHNLDINRMLFNRIPIKEWLFFVWYDYKISKIWRKSPKAGLTLLRKQIANIKLTPHKKSGHNKKQAPEITNRTGSHVKRNKFLVNLFEKEQPKSIMVFGIPDDDFLPIVCGNKRRCVVIDIEEDRLNKIYEQVRHSRMDVLPLSLNFCSPPKAYGIGNMCKAPQDRLRMDFGIMLWSSYACIQLKKYPLEKIVEGLSMFVKNKLLVEYEENTHEFINRLSTKQNENRFSLDKFQNILKHHFQDVRLHHLNESRWMLFCKR